MDPKVGSTLDKSVLSLLGMWLELSVLNSVLAESPGLELRGKQGWNARCEFAVASLSIAREVGVDQRYGGHRQPEAGTFK